MKDPMQQAAPSKGSLVERPVSETRTDRSGMKIAIEDGAVRYATDDDVNSAKLQVVKGTGSDVVLVTYILAGTAEEDVLTLPMSKAVTGWEFFQMGIDRHTDFSVRAISASIWPGKSSDVRPE